MKGKVKYYYEQVFFEMERFFLMNKQGRLFAVGDGNILMSIPERFEAMLGDMKLWFQSYNVCKMES
ncbi:hypothetical protein CW304_15015 [Bacillus sp. UFRGS-B20]|nr:hypothetical protein CW304_15015 [Bacillus sp. UFRGS-B20]